MLFGAPIQENVAIKTYEEFERANVVTPDEIVKTGWHGLVDLLDKGGYVRYDYKTADKLLEMAETVKEKGIPYTEEGICGLAKGIGKVTAHIFLRELRDGSIDHEVGKFVYEAAENLGLVGERTLQELKEVWDKNRIEGYTFATFEVALLRLGKNYCKKGKHDQCGLREWCIKIAQYPESERGQDAQF